MSAQSSDYDQELVEALSASIIDQFSRIEGLTNTEALAALALAMALTIGGVGDADYRGQLVEHVTQRLVPVVMTAAAAGPTYYDTKPQ
jgi:hypothetical protein